MNSDSSIPASLSLTVGQKHDLRLHSLGTSGYVWTARSDRECVEVSRTRGRAAGGGPGASGAVGASSDEIIVLRAISPGTATVQLEQRRPWAPNDEPLSSITIEVTVT